MTNQKRKKPLLAHLDFLKKSHISRILLIYFFSLAVFSHTYTVPFCSYTGFLALFVACCQEILETSWY